MDANEIAVSFKKLESEYQQKSERVATLDAQVKDLESRRDKLSPVVTSLVSQRDDLTQQIAGEEKKLVTLREEAGKLDSAITQRRGRLAELEHQIVEIKERFDAVLAGLPR